MSKQYDQAEDVLADEEFQAWYFKRSPEQVQAWEEWLQANPQYLPLVQEAIGFIQSMPRERTAVSDADLELQLQQLNNKLEHIPAKAPVKRLLPAWLRVAAAALVLSGAAWLGWKWITPSQQTIAAPPGHTLCQQLPDGSELQLNANSEVKLKRSWNGTGDREIWLEGEAFFKVKKTPGKNRFIVHAGTVDIEVTGTQFNVKRRNGSVAVLLTEGSVQVHLPDGKLVHMQPGDYLDLDKSQAVQNQNSKDEILAWQENRLAFQETSLKEVARVIENYYGVKVEINDSRLQNTRLTGILPNDQLGNLLNAIHEALGVNVNQSGKTIQITAGNR